MDVTAMIFFLSLRRIKNENEMNADFGLQLHHAQPPSKMCNRRNLFLVLTGAVSHTQFFFSSPLSPLPLIVSPNQE